MPNTAPIRNQRPRHVQRPVHLLGINNLGPHLVRPDDLPLRLVLHYRNPVNRRGVREFQRHPRRRGRVGSHRVDDWVVVARLDEISELLVPRGVARGDQPAAVGREIELEETIAAHGLVVHVDHLVQGAQRLVFAPEPSVFSLEGGVALCGRKVWTGGITAIIGHPCGPDFFVGEAG